MKSIENKITFSFSAITFTFLVMTIIIFIQVNQTTELSRKLQYVLVPSIEANLRMANAVNASSNSLQTWIMTKDDRYLRQRAALWDVIGNNHQQLKELSDRWAEQEQLKRLASLGEKLILLEKQQKILEIQADNALAFETKQLFIDKVLPLNEQVIETLRYIHDPQRWDIERTFLLEESEYVYMKNMAIFFLALSSVGSLILGYILYRAVIFPLNRTAQLAENIAAGNYTLNTKLLSGDEKLDLALLNMTNQLNQKQIENINQQEQLEEYNNKLEASNEELSQFSYRTSHDLKAPLITVRGLANAIEEDIGDGDFDEAKRNAHKIALHVKRLEDLVVDILSLAKAELEESTDEKIALKAIVDEVKDSLFKTYIDHDVVITVLINDSDELFTSKVRLRQVLENLISNAIKYKDQRKSSSLITISTKVHNSKYQIFIEDNGLGIPNISQSYVFKMFQRFHPNIRYGSGLGLYIVKKHIEKMNGHISFNSSERGTTFTLTFPVISRRVYDKTISDDC